ncbi:MAG TPA: hypothetical protein VK469_03955, partial [Candidatus Kapabacteria bacterium]|nr:hypothetical protein [Candidatus Kapabacteria bacterium]
MQAFKTTYVLETKRALNKKAISLFLFISLLSLYFVQTGVGKYKNIMESRYTFQDFERLKIKQYLNYNQYGAHGFRILFIPSPLSIYFVNSSAITELTANVDSGEQLNIYNSFKGKLLFTEKSGGLKDFSGFLLLLGSLLILYFGYEAFIYKDYLRFMSGFIDYKRFFFAIVLSRMFIFIFFFLLNAGLSIVLLGFNGIRLSEDDLLHALIYVGVLALMMMLFFIVGTVACSFKSNFAGLVMIIVSWFTLVYLIPGAVNTVIYQKADRIIPDYQLELQKLKNLLEFERRAFEETVTKNTPNPGNIKERKNTMSDGEFNHKRFKQIQALEERLANEMSKNISDFQTLSVFFPSTFYLSVGNEIGGNGYENFTRFFEYIRALKI